MVEIVLGIIVLLIIALPFYLMFDVNFFLGVGVFALYDFALYKLLDIPIITVFVTSLLRILLYIALVGLILFGAATVAGAVLGISFEALGPVSHMMRMIHYYLS